MRLANLLGPDLKALLHEDTAGLRDALEEFHPEDIAELLEDLPLDDVVGLVEALPNDYAADLIERLTPERQVDVVSQLDQASTVGVVAEMDPDDRVDLFQELEDDEARTLLTQLAEVEPEAAEEVRELSRFGPETAGGLMTTEYLGLTPDTKIWQAIEEVRHRAREDELEAVDYVYVVYDGESERSQLLGVASFRDLILADPGQTLADIMTGKTVRVRPETDQEEVARVIARYDLAAVPVVDHHGRMQGVVTVDDVVDVVIEEATEDAQKMGGVVPLEDSYFSTGLFEFVWKRGAWLIVLFLGQLLTATVMAANEAAIEATVELALFIPLIISSGGNAGSQSSTLIIRAMAIGEARPADWLKVLGRELGIGAALGVVLGLMGFGRAYLSGGEVDPVALGLTVGGSIVAIVSLSTVIGSLLPMLIRRLGLDPAVSSTPFIASVVDVLGLLVYFTIAGVVLHTAFL